MELALYNGAISGIAISGDAFFYQNPLASNGGQRSSWIGLSCCPTNLARIIPQVGGFVYAQERERLYVNLFAAGEATVDLNGGARVKLSQATDYPWNGSVRLSVDPQQPADLTLCLRLPSWARGRPVPSDLYRFADADVPPVSLKINGEAVDATPHDDGYVHLKRRWQPGDRVEFDLPMPIRRVYTHENVEDNRGKVALMRGPIVYCLEAADHRGVNVAGLRLAQDTPLRAEHRPGLLGGVSVLLGEAQDGNGEPVTLTAVPYYAWCNREKGSMTVWIDEPAAAPTDLSGHSAPKSTATSGP